ncbi:MAG: hypothetical protein H0T89_20485, partial [Deltaproteobacteria bacterium]|nr:hypothetical protein [Deltaproteobacteria bacterium]
RERASVAGVSRATLTITTGTPGTAGSSRTKLDIGAPLEGAGQTWVVSGEHALLVDDWVARALAPEPLALRITRPFAEVAAATRIVIERVKPPFTLHAEGSPRRLARPYPLVLAPRLASELHRALAGLTIVALPTAPGGVSGATAVAITTADPTLVTVEVRAAGCAEPLVAISGTLGDGCVRPEQVDAVGILLLELERPPAELVDRRALVIDPIRITLADGSVLDLASRPKIGDVDADPNLVTELLLALGSPMAEVIAVDPAVRPLATLTAVDRAGTSQLIELLPGNMIRRHGEPVALRPGPGAWDILRRPSSALRDPTLWSEETTTIRTIKVDATTYTRGAVIGEWTRSGPGKDKPDAINGLARALSLVRAGPLATRPRVRHRVEVEIAAPSRASSARRVLELGARLPAGCEAIVDGTPLLLETAICDHVAELVR